MQDLADLDLDDRGKLRSAVMNSSDTKLVFGMHNNEDAQELARTMFASEIATDRIKYQGPEVTNAIPIPRAEEVTEVSRTHASALAGGQGSGRGGGDSRQDSEGQSFDPSRDEILTSRGLARGSNSVWNEQENKSWSDSDSETSRTHTERWTDFEYERVPQTPVFYSPEEMTLKYAAAIMRQQVGHALLKYDPVKPAVLIRTPAPGSREFPDVVAVPSLLEECREYVYRRLEVPTAAQARAEIEARQKRVLELPASHAEVLGEQLDHVDAIKRVRAARRRR
jgi:hypothetical protein